MSDVNYAEMTEGFEEVPENYGQEMLVSGWYPFKIEKAEIGKSRNGVPLAHLQLSVGQEGPATVRGRRSFVDVYLGASKSKRSYDEDETGKKVMSEKQRTVEEFKDARTKAQANVKRFLKAIGLTTGVPTAPPTDEQFIAQFFRVGEWEGKKFVGKLSVEESDSGYTNVNLRDYAHVEDSKKGIVKYMSEGWGKAKTEAELVTAARQQVSTNVAKVEL